MAEGFVGGASAYNILTQPPQVTALTLTAGNAKIDGSFRTVDAAYSGLAHDYWIVRQAGRIPDHPYDGIGVVIPNPSNTSTLSFSLTSLINDIQYGVRVFVRGDYGFQTSPTVGGYATPRGGIAIGTLPLKTRIRYGKIYGTPITWIIADKNHPGYPANSTTIITEQIIKMMCFDAKEPSNPLFDRKRTGNNRYSVSNVRQWLNSKAGANAWYTPQHIFDTPPSTEYVYADGGGATAINPYDTVAGFLNPFSENERNVLIDTTLTVNKSTSDGGGIESCTDKIFLPSCTEMNVQGNAILGSKLAIFSNDLSRIATVTSQCVANSNWSSNPVANAPYHYFLRDASASQDHTNGLISKDGNFWGWGTAYYGYSSIRPMCNLHADLLLSPIPNADGSYNLLVA